MHRNFKIANGMAAGQVAHRVPGEKRMVPLQCYLAQWRKALCWSADSRFSRR